MYRLRCGVGNATVHRATEWTGGWRTCGLRVGGADHGCVPLESERRKRDELLEPHACLHARGWCQSEIYRSTSTHAGLLTQLWPVLSCPAGSSKNIQFGGVIFRGEQPENVNDCPTAPGRVASHGRPHSATTDQPMPASPRDRSSGRLHSGAHKHLRMRHGYTCGHTQAQQCEHHG